MSQQQDRVFIEIAHRSIAAVGTNDEEVWSRLHGLMGVAHAIVRSGHAPLRGLLDHVVETARAILHRQMFGLDPALDEQGTETLHRIVAIFDLHDDTFDGSSLNPFAMPWLLPPKIYR